jgi:pimeloyl-ACP methyl ester carboxylesterase
MLQLLLGVGVALGSLAAAALALRALLQRRVARRLRIEVPPGVAEEGFWRLGGIEQWVTVRGERADAPILLVLHGGPGAPYSLFTPALRSWERSFTLVQWDRRGAGLTLGRNGRAGCGEVSFARMVDDAVELRHQLAQRLPGRPVTLLASSAGTLVGLPLIRRRPDLFAAFVGTDFNPGLGACEAVAFPATLAWARAHAPREVGFLERLGPDPAGWDLAGFNRLMRLRDRTTHDGRGMASTFLPAMLSSPRHRWRDLRAVVEGLGFSTERLFSELVAFDARAVAPAVERPFFVFQGDSDVFTPLEVVEAFIATLEAPVKHLERIPGAGHLGGFTRPERLLERLLRHLGPLGSGPPPAAAAR